MNFEVDQGDLFGFYWFNYSVVGFNLRLEWKETSMGPGYCGGVVRPEQGGSVSLHLNDTWSYHDYGIWFDFCSKYNT